MVSLRNVLDMKKIISDICMLPIVLLALLLSGCSEDESRYEANLLDGNRMSFVLHMPGFHTVSRAVDENAIESLHVAFLDSGGEVIDSQYISADDVTSEADGYVVTLEVPDGAAMVEMISNLPSSASGDELKIMTGNPNQRATMVFYGKTQLGELENANPVVEMVRCLAKTEFHSSAEGFVADEVEFYGMPSSGLIACEADGDMPCVPSGVTYASVGEKIPSGGSLYHYEAPAGKCFLIIRGRYNGVEGYYKAAYIPRDTDASFDDADGEVPILRNHRYVFEVESVNDYGWPTREEALMSLPDNRMAVLLKDYDEAVYNMIACRDYYLGVSRDLEVDADAVRVDIAVFTSYNGRPAYDVDISAEDNWVKGFDCTAQQSVVDDDTHTAGMRYVITFALEVNDRSSREREAEIVIRSGDLSRTVRIVQAGWDFRRDPNRRVLIYNLDGNPQGQDYFRFIEEELQGASEAEMRVVRNDGLHFSVFGNEYYYTIPKLDGDSRIIISGGEKFRVDDTGAEWKVTCTGHEDYGLWTGSFAISNSVNGSEIVYDVYHTGLIHRLYDGGYIAQGPDGTIPSGWFYYEQVDVCGRDGSTIHLLDRNLGASSNRAYSPAGVLSSGNTSSRGAYFRISNGKDDRMAMTLLPPPGFEIPEAYHLDNIGITTLYASEGAVGVLSSAGFVDRVYFPLSGNMDGNTHTDPIHGCLWSQTLLSGNQGFAETSEEYGYWYRYLDIYGSKVALKNMRIGNRTAQGGVDVYRTMPVRCMKGGATPPGWGLPEPAEGRRRVIYTNPYGWSVPYAYVWRDSDKKAPWAYPGYRMNKLSDSVFYCDVPDYCDMVLFNNGSSGQTADIPLAGSVFIYP